VTDRDRQRRLHVENRLAELNAKFGPVEDDLPDWLDHLIEEAVETAPQAVEEVPQVTEPSRTPWQSEAIDLSRYG